MSISKYNKRRDFLNTPEPKGKIKLHDDLKFVVQKHNASRLHYDFRLEVNGVLKSWAVPKGPSINPVDKRLAVKTEDHPYDYLTFEGTIPQGNYGAGDVIVWDLGNYAPRVKTGNKNLEMLKEINKGHLTFVLNGEKLKGEFALVKIANQDKNWLLIKKNDKYAKKQKQISEGSVLSDREIKEIAKMPDKVKPMLSTLINNPFNKKGWIFEIKWDGYRAIAHTRIDGKNQLYSRNFLSFEDRFKPIFNVLKEIKHDAVLDGEIVVIDNLGKPNFQLLQDYKKIKGGNLVYYAFDILYLDGYDLKNLPLIKRKHILKEIIPQNSIIKFSDHVEEDGENFLKLAVKKTLEGIIAKKKESVYTPGKRTSDWLKIKSYLRQEAIICGYTEPLGSRHGFGALILGTYKNGKLTYIGHAGTGFDENKIKLIKTKLDKLKTNTPATWVKPVLVCEVKYTEWTKDKLMRHPVFISLRDDKNPQEIKIEVPKQDKIFKDKNLNKEIKINGKKLKLTNLEKVFWPEEKIAKIDLIEYYLRISDYILPYLVDRPQSLHRYPNGIYNDNFYQKNMPQYLPRWVKTIKIKSEHENREVKYFLCQNKESLIYLINLGCIDLNPWSSTINHPDYPDFIVIDLDPEDIAFEYVVESALAVKEVLDEINIKSYPKTSGATGMHIYIPTGGKYTYKQIRNFAKIIVTIVQKNNPKITSIKRSPLKRRGKVYLDYLQNIKGQTLASPYSVRPMPFATVSAPLKWREVKKGLLPKNFTIKNISKRLETVGDIFRPVLNDEIDMEKAVKKLETLI